MVLETFNLDYLLAFPAGAENCALFPVVDVKGLSVKALIINTTEIAHPIRLFLLLHFLPIVILLLLLLRRMTLELLLIRSHLKVLILLLIRPIRLILLIIVRLYLLLFLNKFSFLPLRTLLRFNSFLLTATTRVYISCHGDHGILRLVEVFSAFASV